MPDTPAPTLTLIAVCRIKQPHAAPPGLAVEGEVGAVNLAAFTVDPTDTSEAAEAQRRALGVTPYLNLSMTILDPAVFATYVPGQAYAITVAPIATPDAPADQA